MSAKRRRSRLLQRQVIKVVKDSDFITLRLTAEEHELLYDVLEHVAEQDWDEFAEEANTRRRQLAESVGDKLEPERTLTPKTFEKIFSSLFDKQWGGIFGDGSPN